MRKEAIRIAALTAAAWGLCGSNAAQEQAASAQSPPLGYPSQGAVRFVPGVAAELEVLRVPTGHLLVRPVVNGHAAGWFIFDTGAGIGVVSTPGAGGFELTSDGTIDAVGVRGQQAEILRAARFELGPIVLADLPMISVDLSFLRQHLGEEIAGVVGYGLLSRCVAEIDLARARVALHDPTTFTLSRGEWTPMALDKFVPVVSARFEDHEGRFTLDTGANGAISFHSHAVERLALLEGRATTDGRLGGVGGFLPTKRGRLAWIELGGRLREDVPADFEVESKDASDHRIVGNIGAGLLRDFVLVTDYGSSRIAFRPAADGVAGG